MTLVPLPDVPCVRVNMSGVDDAGTDWGTRFFLSYSGSAPSGANCGTLASDIKDAWNTSLAPLTYDGIVLNEVDVLDIATRTGLSGQWTGSAPGTRSGTSVPIQVCFDVEYGIARRYRGGKPRGYWPFGVNGDLHNQAQWVDSFVTTVTPSVAAFFAAIEALTIGSMGTLRHVNLSYYQGFTNHTSTSGRERAVPTYRPTALHDDITGYFGKQRLGSQKRRRSATTP